MEWGIDIDMDAGVELTEGCVTRCNIRVPKASASAIAQSTLDSFELTISLHIRRVL